jgi:hypothetical protein
LLHEPQQSELEDPLKAQSSSLNSEFSASAKCPIKCALIFAEQDENTEMTHATQIDEKHSLIMKLVKVRKENDIQPTFLLNATVV